MNTLPIYRAATHVNSAHELALTLNMDALIASFWKSPLAFQTELNPNLSLDSRLRKFVDQLVGLDAQGLSILISDGDLMTTRASFSRPSCMNALETYSKHDMVMVSAMDSQDVAFQSSLPRKEYRAPVRVFKLSQTTPDGYALSLRVKTQHGNSSTPDITLIGRNGCSSNAVEIAFNFGQEAKAVELALQWQLDEVNHLTIKAA